MLKNDLLKEWDVSAEDFPAGGSFEEIIKHCLRYAILAPSTHNSQPWLFKITRNRCTVMIDKSVKLPEGDPSGSYLYISLGCCLENLIVAAKYFGVFKSVKYLKNSKEKVAEILFTTNGRTRKDDRLIKAINSRLNARGLFKKKRVSNQIINHISSIRTKEGVRVFIIDEKKKINQIAELTAKGIKRVYSRKRFRNELSSMINNNLSPKRVGIPGYALKLPLIISMIFPFLMKVRDLSPVISKLNFQSVKTLPLIFVITSEKESSEYWVRVGRTMERIMLELNSRGVQTSIFVASLEVDRLRKKVKKIINAQSEPQIIFGAGYIKGTTKHTPRIPLQRKIV